MKLKHHRVVATIYSKQWKYISTDFIVPQKRFQVLVQLFPYLRCNYSLSNLLFVCGAPVSKTLQPMRENDADNPSIIIQSNEILHATCSADPKLMTAIGTLLDFPEKNVHLRTEHSLKSNNAYMLLHTTAILVSCPNIVVYHRCSGLETEARTL